MIGEFELIRRFFDRGPPRDARLGVGDDCALLAPLDPHSVFAISTDLLLEGRHFFADADPASLGHKSLAVNLSDLAAMGARPRAFTLAIALPDVDERWLAAFCEGLFALADRHGCELIGGDTTRGPRTVCITVFGEVPEGAALRRDSAQPDDDLWVSGALGAAALAVRERRAGRALAADDDASFRLERPEPRVVLGLALRHVARAAIDLSDGLLGDLAHIVERSRVGAEVDWPAVPVDARLDALDEGERLPLALSGGDDYELLFSAAPENRTAIAAIGARLGVPLARIGRIVCGSEIRVRDARGRAIPVEARGFDHFA
ncbi:MAG TPA: thiamine-phosphate kinase [Zeimonas sp.]